RTRADVARLRDPGIVGGPLRVERADRRDDALRLRRHRARRLQRHPLVAAEESDRALLARRRTPEGDGDGRGSDVPAQAGVVYDAMAGGAEGLQAAVVRMRRGSGAAVGAVHSAAIQVTRSARKEEIL